MESTISSIIEPAVTVSPDQTVSEVISKLSSSPLRAVVVVEPGKVIGVVSDRSMRDFSHPSVSTKSSSVAVKSPVLEKNSSIDEALAYFLDPQFRVIPVVAGSKFLGVVGALKALSIVKDRPNLKSRKVEDYLGKSEGWISGDSSISQARSKMKSLSSYHLAVTDSKGVVTSLVSTFDIATKVTAHSHDSFPGKRSGTPTPEMDVSNEKVSTISTTQFSQIKPGATLYEAVAVMVSKNVSALPVIDGGRFMGFLTVRDCIRALEEHEEAGVFVFGLNDGDKAMSESIRSYAQLLLNKWSVKGEADAVYIHLKSVAEGNKHRYSAKARAVIGQKVFSVSTPERDDHFRSWDPFSEVKEVLEELSRVLSDKVHSKSRRINDKRDERSDRDGSG